MEKLIVIKTLKELQQLKPIIASANYIAYDTETTGVLKDSNIIGFSIAVDTETAYYVVLSSWNPKEQKLIDLETRRGVVDILSLLPDKKLIMHNAIFDCWMTLNNFGIKLIQSVHTDTMVLAHLLNENRQVGLKELGTSIFGEDASEPQRRMKESVKANGGAMTKALYEMYKCDTDILALYGAKDAVLTMKILYVLVEDLFAQGLDKFFYDDETMPLLRGPMYDLNTTGLRVDLERLQSLKREIEVENLELQALIQREIKDLVKAKYPGTTKANTFNIGSGQQIAWLLFDQMGKEFGTLTQGGKEIAKFLGNGIPYSFKAKRGFVGSCRDSLGQVYSYDKGKPKKVKEWWTYVTSGKEILGKYALEYKWIEALLKLKKNEKILGTYLEGIEERLQYGIIRPNFLQHGTTSGRKSCRNPNFQNLPRDDKRVKSCIIARPGKTFVGADFSQLEPRVFAYFSGDERLLASFKSAQDFYSVIGMEVFDKYDCKPEKDGSPESFAVKYKKYRDMAKVVALSATYGTTAHKMAGAIGKSVEAAQEVIDNYFVRFPKVQQFMLDSHKEAKTTGQVVNLFGRPRRIPQAKDIEEIYGNRAHGELPYEARNTLNLAVNHIVQATGASILSRAEIAFCQLRDKMALVDDKWQETRMVMSIHDEVIIECPEEIAEEVKTALKHCMEHSVELPGVDLVAEPVIAKTLSELK